MKIDQDIPNAAQPTPGQGVVLDLNGLLPNSIMPPATSIADGTIVNADVNAAAAIDYSKMNNPGGTTNFLREDGTFALPVSVIAPTHLPGMGSAGTGFAVTANTAYFMPIGNVVTTTTITRISWGLVTLVAGNYDVGIFYSDNESNFTLLGSSGSTAQPAAGNIISNLSTQTITPVTGRRWYYAIALSTASTVVAAAETSTRAGGIPGYTKAGLFPLTTTSGLSAIGAAPLIVLHGAV